MTVCCAYFNRTRSLSDTFGSQLDRVPGAIAAIEKIDKDKKLYGGVSEKAKESDECIICTEKFAEDTEVCELGCDERHIFHVKCINEWMKRSTTCPVCRKEVKEID